MFDRLGGVLLCEPFFEGGGEHVRDSPSLGPQYMAAPINLAKNLGPVPEEPRPILAKLPWRTVAPRPALATAARAQL